MPLTRNSLQAGVHDKRLLLKSILKSFCCLQLEARISAARLQFILPGGSRKKHGTRTGLPQPPQPSHAATTSSLSGGLTSAPGTQAPSKVPRASRARYITYYTYAESNQADRKGIHSQGISQKKLRMQKIKPNSKYQPGPLSQKLVRSQAGPGGVMLVQGGKPLPCLSPRSSALENLLYYQQ